MGRRPLRTDQFKNEASKVCSIVAQMDSGLPDVFLADQVVADMLRQRDPTVLRDHSLEGSDYAVSKVSCISA